MSILTFNVFHEQERLVAAVRSGRDLTEPIRRMATVSLASALVYGMVLGVQMGGWQVVASPVKLPLILLGTCAICIAGLYVLLALAGAHLDFKQVVALALCSVTATGVTMAALLPVTAFWTFVFQGNLLAVTSTHSLAFALAGWVGVRFGLQTASAALRDPRLVRAVMVWMWVYGLVGQQMAWIFRPHFHATEIFMRPLFSGGSALEYLMRLLLGHR